MLLYSHYNLYIASFVKDILYIHKNNTETRVTNRNTDKDLRIKKEDGVPSPTNVVKYIERPQIELLRT
jgi:hypothetical protein